MSEPTFVDHYEILQLSPNATVDTVERVYRMLARRFHPDNQETGDAGRFADLQHAYDTLSNPDPARRLRRDLRREPRPSRGRCSSRTAPAIIATEDRRLFHAILSLLYIARKVPGTTGCPIGNPDLRRAAGD